MGSAKGVSVPVGFRFHPTEEELVDHFLKKKNQDKDFNFSHIIPDIDVCKYDPWDLPAFLYTEPDSPYHDLEWFFFSPRDYKYMNSTRSNRTTPKGYWKITGKERVIKARRSKAVIGKKRTLTFYEGRVPKSKKTNWVMHEYYILAESESLRNSKLAQRDFVLCRLKKKSDKKDTAICAEGEPSGYNVSNCEDQAAPVVTPESQDYSYSTLPSPACIELGDVLQANGTINDCNEMQSPSGDNYYSVTHNNDTSTCDEGEPHCSSASNFETEPADGSFRELFAQPVKDLDRLQVHVTQQPPTHTKLRDVMHINVSNDDGVWLSPFGDNDSYVTYKNNISTNEDSEPANYTAYDLENQAANNRTLQPDQPQDYSTTLPHVDVYNDECSEWLSPFWDSDSYLSDKNNISTNDDDEQVSNMAADFVHPTTDETILEVCPPPEENLELLFHPPQPEDYTLQPLMKIDMGDVLHDNDYIECNDFQSPIWR